MTATAIPSAALGTDTRPQPVAQVTPRATPAIAVWGGIGALIVAVEAYLIIRWVSGPYLKTVPSGPSVPPTYMKVGMITAQIVLPAIVLVFLYRFVIRPWRRERRVSGDGMLCMGLLVISFFDPLSCYLQNWFTYNSYFLNFGSLVKGVPGWVAPEAPGKMIAFPLLFIPPVYGGLLLAGMIGGCWVMTRLRSRWPTMSNVKLIAFAYLIFVVFDAVMEASTFMPLGFYTETGFSLDSGHYYSMPISNVLLGAATWLSVCCVRFFKNDRGEMVFERGAEKIASGAKRGTYRFLGAVAAMFLGFFVFYHVPQTLVQGSHPGSWSVVEHYSYFTNHLCGPGTDRACAGPGIPASGPGAPYLDPSGRLVVPPAAKQPAAVRFADCPYPAGSAIAVAHSC